jgi:methylated-DNA-[protein]-cysteine S-methyltransferase
MTRYHRFTTPLGRMYAVAHDEALAGIYFDDARHAPAIEPGWVEDDKLPVLRECAKQVAEYFAGKRRTFDLAWALEGTPFQHRVWEEIARIPFGETVSYSELAARAGAPGASRAAGAATGRNPLTIVIPCHRVVGTRGDLTGYAGGMERKVDLLTREGVLQESLI